MIAKCAPPYQRVFPLTTTCVISLPFPRLPVVSRASFAVVTLCIALPHCCAPRDNRHCAHPNERRLSPTRSTALSLARATADPRRVGRHWDEQKVRTEPFHAAHRLRRLRGEREWPSSPGLSRRGRGWSEGLRSRDRTRRIVGLRWDDRAGLRVRAASLVLLTLTGQMSPSLSD